MLFEVVTPSTDVLAMSYLCLWLSHFDQVRMAVTVSSGWGCVECNQMWTVLVFTRVTMCIYLSC